MAFVRALALAPHSARGLYGLGRAHLQTDSLQAALGVLEKALARDPSHIGAHYEAGIVALRLEKRERARRYLLRVLVLDPGHDTARSVLAAVPGD